MKHLAIILALLLAVTTSAHARLGETLAEITARLGPPQLIHTPSMVFASGKYIQFGDNYTFTKDGYTVICGMLNGYCANIQYVKNGRWTEEQITTILQNESQGCTWTETSPTSMNPVNTAINAALSPQLNDMKNIQFHKRDWKRSDGGIATGQAMSITVTTPKFLFTRQQAIDQAAADNTKVPNL